MTYPCLSDLKAGNEPAGMGDKFLLPGIFDGNGISDGVDDKNKPALVAGRVEWQINGLPVERIIQKRIGLCGCVYAQVGNDRIDPGSLLGGVKAEACQVSQALVAFIVLAGGACRHKEDGCQRCNNIFKGRFHAGVLSP